MKPASSLIEKRENLAVGPNHVFDYYRQKTKDVNAKRIYDGNQLRGLDPKQHDLVLLFEYFKVPIIDQMIESWEQRGGIVRHWNE